VSTKQTISLFCLALSLALPGLIIAASVPALAVDVSSSDNYPRVAIMESSILGKTYPADALADRLARMEVKAFGKASANADLSERSDNLQNYVESKSHQKLIQPGPGYQSADDDSAYQEAMRQAQSGQGNAPPDADDTPPIAYPRVTALEQAILGEVHESDSLSDRLSRMEVKAFGNAMPKSDYGDRTDALEDYAEKKLHKKILGQSGSAADQGGADGSGGRSGGTGSFLAKMGGALLGIPSAGVPGAPNSRMVIPAFGPFGGVRVHPRTASSADDQGQSQVNDPVPLDDSIINSPTPPPADARLLTKVSWCEKHVFGVVYRDKHLTERLNILNDNLKYDPAKKGMALMDDVDKLMQAAQARPAAAAP